MRLTNLIRLYTLFFVSAYESRIGETLEFKYLSAEELKSFLNNLASQHSDKAKVGSIGKSLQGRDLLYIELTDNIAEENQLRPRVKLIGGVHGDEPIGHQMIVFLAQYILENYATDDRINNILQTIRLFILPSFNPDGFKISTEGDCEGMSVGRKNANGADLNKQYPGKFGTAEYSMTEEPEALALMKWMENTHFVMSLTLHSGMIIATYPYDSSDTGAKKGYYSKTLDDEFFKLMAFTYATKHTKMSTLTRPCGKKGFENGITNGAFWYTDKDTMQDYNYAQHGCLEIFVEIGCCRFPGGRHLEKYWSENKEALISFIELSNRGIKGHILDQSSQEPISGATINIIEIGKNMTSDENGVYWRLLPPGEFLMTVHKEGYITSSEIILTITEGMTQYVGVKLVKEGESAPTIPTTTTKSYEDVTEPAGSSLQNRINLFILLMTLLYSIYHSV